MKRTLFRIFIVLAIISTAWRLYVTFRPTAKLEIGRETTFISEPLADDGIPNFCQAIHEVLEEGVTPENNGAIELWQAMGLGPDSPNAKVLNPFEFDLLCDDIGVGQLPDSHLDEIGSATQVASLTSYLKNRFDTEELKVGGEALRLENAAERLLRACQSHPWGKDDLPPLANWCADNEIYFDLLKRAAEKPKFYSPSVDYILDPNVSLVEYTLPHCNRVRGATRALSARSMFRLNSGDIDGAVDDVETILRLGENAHGLTLVESLVTVSIRTTVYDCVHTILNSPSTRVRHTKRCTEALESLQPVNMVAAIDFGERLMFIDAALRMTTGRFRSAGEATQLKGISPAQLKLSLDPNIPLRMGNEFYDQLVAIGRESDEEKRLGLIAEFDEQISGLSPRLQDRATGFFSRNVRSRSVGAILVSLMLPATNLAYDVGRRDTALRQLTIMATQLRAFELENGDFPADLTSINSRLDDSKQAKKPLFDVRYVRTADGFLLYSFGKDGIDDGGNNGDLAKHDASHIVDDGKWITIPQTGALPDGDDWTILLPLPEMTWGEKVVAP